MNGVLTGARRDFQYEASFREKLAQDAKNGVSVSKRRRGASCGRGRRI